MKTLESDCKLVSSRGLMQICDFYPSNPKSDTSSLAFEDYDVNKIKSGDSVYVHTTCLKLFIDLIVPKIEKKGIKIKLVTGDSDLSPISFLGTTKTIKMILLLAEGGCISHWFAQNLDYIHPRITHIPIGLDYHSQANGIWWGEKKSPLIQEEELTAFRGVKKRENKAYCNFQFMMWEKHDRDRYKSWDVIKDNKALFDIPLERESRLDSWERQSSFKWVVSPHGNGLDCHRTYEAIALGCVPIVRSSSLDVLFRKFPVLIVNDWDDMIEAIKDKNLYRDILKIKNKKALMLDYWRKEINDKQ